MIKFCMIAVLLTGCLQVDLPPSYGDCNSDSSARCYNPSFGALPGRSDDNGYSVGDGGSSDAVNDVDNDTVSPTPVGGDK